MRFRFGLGWQLAFVVALFVGSLVAMLLSSWTAFGLPWREEEVRGQVRQASRRMAEEAARQIDLAVVDHPHRMPELNHRLRSVTESVLAETPGLEGGFCFFRTGDNNPHYLGYAFPTRAGPEAQPDPPPAGPPGDPPPRIPPPRDGFPGDAPPDPPNQRPPGEHGPDGKHRRPPPPPPGPGEPRDVPPPQERRYVTDQVRLCLEAPAGGEVSVLVRDVGPSRVAIAAEPVGEERSARLATWVMARIHSPDQQRDELARSRTSAGLALGGIGLSLMLTANLVRTLRRERGQRESLREELRRAENLASLGRLLAGVAHEVRNPLAALRSTVQLWQRLPDRARTPESMDAVVRSVDRLNDLVSRLLYFARSGHDARTPVDLNAIVRDAFELVRAQADGQKVTLAADLAPDLPPLSGSAQALQQVVLNLATNALQAMPGGGQMDCQTRWLPAEGEAELRIRDSGPGVPAEARARLFEPFFTTRAEGTGLGLALCREIVRQHGGRIDLADGDGRGAEFVVRLPRGKVEEGRP
jgi:two-component system sensor histidine kinase HydH